jgi:hypothetical protein
MIHEFVALSRDYPSMFVVKDAPGLPSAFCDVTVFLCLETSAMLLHPKLIVHQAIVESMLGKLSELY